jgi:hypothetical protein
MPTDKGCALESWDSTAGPSRWAAVEKGERCRGRSTRERIRFSTKGGHGKIRTWRIKRGRTRSSDDGSSKAVEVIRVGGSSGGCSDRGVRLGLTLTTPGPARDHMGRLKRRLAWAVCCGLTKVVAGPVSFKETGPLYCFLIFFPF